MARKNSKEKRFIKVYSESTFTANNEVWVDSVTGVNYLYHSAGYSGGLTPLLDSEGKVVVTSLPKEEY